ncbi:hypothetical protein C8T65DRAFT_743431 [Cerioporus squamosus]|nr:hypothetical protein C8T65DRAFT_743431 [Cerioporus squamosus]
MVSPSVYHMPSIVRSTAPASAEVLSASPPRLSLPDDILPDLTSYLRATKPPKSLYTPEALLKMFMKVAYAARNLEYLRIDEFYNCHNADALDVETGAQLRGLVHLHLKDLTEDILEGGSFFPPSLRVLHLSDFWVLIAPISAFALFFDIKQQQLRALTTLIIEDFEFKDLHSAEVLEEWEWSENAPLTTVRELSLIRVNLHTTISHLARSFPNLHSLCIVEHGFPEEDEYDVGTAPPPRLHFLTVVDPPTLSEDLFVPWTCHRLFCVCTKAFPELYLDLCDKSELVGLTLRVFEMCSDVWDVVVEQLPTISWLELEIVDTDLSSTLWSICLTVLASRWEFRKGDTDADVIREFFDQVAQCLPALRYVALAERDEVSADWKEDYSGDHAPWRWSEVRRDEAGSLVEVLEIPSWRGECMRAYLRDADVQAMDKFDELFAPEDASVA